MTQKQYAYLSYLLRVWREERNDQVVWRASLESAQTGERHGFAAIEELFDFLRQRMESSSEQNLRD